MKYFLQKLTKRMIVVVVLTVIASGSVYTCLPVGMAYAAFVEPTATPANYNQDFTQNIMGANNADNDFDSSTVAANVDGSLIERIEYIIDGIAALWVKSGTILYYNSGNIGIGTSTPSALLEVSGTGQQAVKVTDTTSGITAGIWAGTAQGLVGTYTNTDLRLITNGTSKMTIEADGNIGIGDTTPTYKLDIDGTTRITGALTLDTALDFSDYTNATASTGITFTGDAISTNDSAIVHDNLSGFVANEHLDWTADLGAVNINAGNYTNTTYTSSDFTHDDLIAGTIADHDTDTTGAELTSLADNSIVNTLHRHSELVASDGAPDPALTVNASGFVGIGTSTPSVLLEVSGAGQQGIKVTDTTSGITTGIWAGTAQGLIGTYTNTDLRLITNGTSKLIIDKDGNVGVGTTSVSTYKLNVHGSLYADDIYTSGSTFYMGGNPLLTRDSGTLDFGVETGENIDFTINNSSALYINSAGNLGIGTTSPAYIFDVYGNTRIDGNIIADVPTADNHLTTKAYVDAAASTSKTELWPDGTTCTAGIENQLGWDDGASAITYCDGSNWIIEDTGCGEAIRHGGQSYDTVQIGTQCWFAENLNIGTKITSCTGGYVGICTDDSDTVQHQTDDGIIEKYCYSDDEANCTTDGGFYQWDEAMQYTETVGVQGICPASWHIPTDSEQDTLDQYLSTGTCDTSRSGVWDCGPAGTALKVSGSSGFEGILSGYRNTNGAFSNSGTYAYFWSSSVSGANAWKRDLYSSISTVYRNPYDQANGFSVRCLKN